MQDAFVQIDRLLGKEKAERLARARIAVFGLGACGAAAAEALARCGAASLTLVGAFALNTEEISRHPAALQDTVGCTAAQVLKERIRKIDPDILVHTCEISVTEETMGFFRFAEFDFVIDALTDLQEKLRVLLAAHQAGVPAVSCMETEDLSDVTRLITADIFRSAASPLAKDLCKELKKAGIRKQMAVFSKEKPQQDPERKGSIVFVPWGAGLLLAQEAVRCLTADADEKQKNSAVRLRSGKNGGMRIGLPKVPPGKTEKRMDE